MEKTPKKNEPKKKEWYQTCWGIIIVLLFLLPFAIWWTWAKSNWSPQVKWIVTGIIAVFFIFGMVVSGSSMPTTPKPPTAKPTQATTTETPKAEETKTEEPKKEEPTSTPALQTDNQNISPISGETISQKNAVKMAKSYLGYSAFSHDGLVAQLEYEQFSHADAVYGADNSGANWNEQVAKMAKQYMEYSAFSRGSLIEQLKYEKFTQEQAEYGANAVGL